MQALVTKIPTHHCAMMRKKEQFDAASQQMRNFEFRMRFMAISLPT
jgi:hypothetical protein